MISITHLFYITAGISFYSAFFVTFFASHSKNQKLYLYFALLSLFIGIYQFFSAEYYEAKAMNDALYALKFQIFGALGFIMSLYFFLSEYTNTKINPTVSLLVLLAFVSMAVLNALSPYTLRFDNITATSTLVLPWGETITMYSGKTNPYSLFVRLGYLGILLWGLQRTKVHFSTNRTESILLGLFLFFILLSYVIGFLIDTHKIHFFYVHGFVFFFLIVAVTTSFGLRIFKQQRELELTTLRLNKEIFARKEVEYDLLFNSQHDDLTGLPNRRKILKHLDQTIKQAKRYSTKIAVLFIDLDHFKEINDSLGHIIGDQVLLKVSQSMLDQIRTSDLLARLGGDEFCLLIPFISTPDEAIQVADKLLEVLQKPIYINEHTLYVSGSIGISLYPNDGETAIELLRNADSAMYKAKLNRNNHQFYTKDMTTRALERVELESGLRKALTHEELVVYYQPQIDAKSGKLIGMEALVRWNHPTLGAITPDTFVPLAEETGLIIPLDQWVMQSAMRQIQRWYDAGLNPGILSINLSIKKLQQEDFLSELRDTCTELSFKAKWLELEVTEGQIMNNPERAIATLQQISDMGIQLAIDDFGTGYSSLSYLKRLPINTLKIDKSFVDGLPTDEEDIGICKAIIALAKSLKLNIIAEGVETAEQKDFLVNNGCHVIQGYFYAKPMPAIELEKFLHQTNPALNG